MASVQDRVFDIVAEQLGVSRDQLTRETSFINDLGADSLDTVELVMELEEEFDVNIPEEEAEKIQTVGQAIDYIEKTRSVSVILHRLRLAIGGAKAAAAESQPAGLSLDPTSARAEWRGRRVDLTLSEFRVVMLLAEREGKDVSYREIYNAVKGEGFIAGAGMEGYRANVRALVKRIRQKFKDVDPDFTALENYPGFGYRWRPDAAAE